MTANTDLLNPAFKFLSDNFVSFLLLTVVFLIAYFAIYGIFSAIAGAVSFTSAYYGPFYYSAFGFNQLTYAIVQSIGTLLMSAAVLIFIASLFETIALIKSKKFDFALAIGNGIKRALSNKNLLAIVLLLGFVGGFLSSYAGAGPDYLFYVNWLGFFVFGLFTAAYVGIALGAQSSSHNANFLQVFSKISGNAGAVLYVTLLASIVPVFGIILLPLAVIILES